MDRLSIFLFALSGISIVVGAFYLMYSALASKEGREYNSGVLSQRRTVTKGVHPEMRDVQPGDELMVVSFKEQQKRDKLQQSLQDRIESLRAELEDLGASDDEDDEDDDGDVIIGRK